MLDRILVPLDGSSGAECVLPHVAALAHAFDSAVTFLHVLDPVRAGIPAGSIDPWQWHIDRTEAGAYLDSLVTRFGRAGVQAQSAIVEGRAHERIVACSRDSALTILSSHGDEGEDASGMGGTARKILPRLSSSVLLVRGQQHAAEGMFQYRRVLLPLDGSWRAETVLPLAAALANASGAQLQALHVVGRPEMPRHLPPTPDERDLAQRLTESNYQAAADYFEQLRHRVPVDLQSRVVTGESVVGALHRLVEQDGTDLVILSAHGYTGDTARPFGSVATSLIAYGRAPVLVMQDAAAQPAPCADAPAVRQHDVPRYYQH